MTVINAHPPYPPVLAPCYFFLFSRLKIKMKGHHFDTIEVIEAELQSVLTIFTEHDLQEAFKKWQKHWERCICPEGATSRVMVASRPKVSF
jgi:hypothetical protein